MHTIIDTNIIVAALIKDSTTRKLIIDSPNTLFVPEEFLFEIKKYEEYIKKKSQLSGKDFQTLLELLLRKINIVPEEELVDFLQEAKEIVGDIDNKDVPFFAAALARDAVIWSNDKALKKQEKIVILNTAELIQETRNKQQDTF